MSDYHAKKTILSRGGICCLTEKLNGRLKTSFRIVQTPQTPSLYWEPSVGCHSNRSDMGTGAPKVVLIWNQRDPAGVSRGRRGAGEWGGREGVGHQSPDGRVVGRVQELRSVWFQLPLCCAHTWEETDV